MLTTSPLSINPNQLIFDKGEASTRIVQCKNNSDQKGKLDIFCSDKRFSFYGPKILFTDVQGPGYLFMNLDAGQTSDIYVKFEPSARRTNDSSMIMIKFWHNLNQYEQLELPVNIVKEKKKPQVMSMVVFEKQDREEPSPLECSICYAAYAEDSANRTPRILKECGHTVCERCARELLRKNGNQKIKCPQDQEETEVENGDVENLPQNFAVLEVLRDTSKTTFVPCEEDPSHRAMLFCTTCMVDFCEKCFEQIHSSKTLSKHQNVPISEKPIQLPKCPKHTYNTAEFLCQNPDCGPHTVICHTCLLRNHKDHPYENLMEKLIENEKKAWYLLEKLEVARKNYIEKLTVTNDNLTSFSTGNKEFKQKSEEISKYFKEKEEEAIQSLKDYCADKRKHLKQRMNELRKESRIIQDLIAKIDTIWKTKKDLHLIEGMNKEVMEMFELSVISEKHESLDQARIVWKNGTGVVFI